MSIIIAAFEFPPCESIKTGSELLVESGGAGVLSAGRSTSEGDRTELFKFGNPESKLIFSGLCWLKK